jgi:hypothetical protein
MSDEFAAILLILLLIWSLVTMLFMIQFGDVTSFLRSTQFGICAVGYVIIFLIYPVGKKLFGGNNHQ